jgi:integrase
MRRLLTAADADFRVQMLFAALTGVRAGELHALRWKHIDLVNGEVRIETRVDQYGEEDVTKTVAGVRTVPLGSTLIDALTAWKARTLWPKEDDLAFPNEAGRYLDHTNMVRDKFVPLFGRLERQHAHDPEAHAPAPAYFNWHALRHFAISCWIEAGLAPKTVQTFAGHSTLAVTMDRYGHLFKSDDHKAAMDEIARTVEGGSPHLPKTPQKRLEKAKDYIP